ncbi:MAG: YerC/YecD family TrpR-related protein [Lysobacter sp.]
MKRRSGETEDSPDELDPLASAFAALRGPDEVRAFLLDLCTPAELEAMTDRWLVVPLLLQRIPYREIHERTQVSVTTIGRVARTIEYGAGGYVAAIARTGSGPA